jgi:hypothetical protein
MPLSKSKFLHSNNCLHFSKRPVSLKWNAVPGLKVRGELLITVRECFVRANICNKGESAASFCCQMATWFQDLLCNFYFMENHKIAKNSTPPKGGEKISTDLKSLELKKFFDVCLT